MSAIIQRFKDWLQNQTFKNAELHYEVSETNDNADDEVAVWVDFESPKYLSRITIWDTGICILEVLDDKGENIMLDKLSLTLSDDFDTRFEVFINTIDN